MKKTIISTSIATAILLSGCTQEPQTAKVEVQKNLQFENINVPRTEIEKRKVLASSTVLVDGKLHDIGFNTILRSGEELNGAIFGQIFDTNSNPIMEEDGSLKISNANDFSSLIKKDKKIFMVSHFESRPAAMYISELTQDKNGYLEAVSTKNIDFSKFGGLWVPCAGSLSPWNTHLGSEEYEPDAKKVKDNGSIDDYYDAMGDYFGGDLTKLNPYNYGWSTEVKVLNDKGELDVKKHYTMGRFAHELAYVMPDEKTVYLSDDGTNGVLFMFIADERRDLSSGELFAAKWIQAGSSNGGIAKLKWISLGHASNDEVKKALDEKLTFNDIFDYKKPDGATPPQGFTSVNTSAGHEWLKVKEGMEKVASRLESRRYAAMLGATSEFRKMEGITFNKDRNELYIAISSVGRGMEDFGKKGKSNDKYDIGGSNDIKLPFNPCGTVYKLDMSKDETNPYIALNMQGMISGSVDGADEENSCSVNGLANPDNISMIANSDQLLIGEDTGSGHQNDYVWTYDLTKDKLTRILTTPYGSETTSVYHYDNINGYSYIMGVVQHPYGEGDKTTKEEDMPQKANGIDNMRGYTGYIGPMPVITK